MSSINGQPGSVQGSVYTALRKSIINLNLEPGASISEKEVSLKYNVSRTPVREAFIHLADEGLIQVIPQKETRISPIDFKRVSQEFFLRDNLESAVIWPFIERAGAEHFTQLENSIQQQAVLLQQNNYIEFLAADNMFHRIFFDGAGEELAWNMLDSQCGHYYRVRLLTTWLNGIAANIVEQHKQILGALKDKNAIEARMMFRRHIHKLSEEEAILREKFPGYFAVADNTDAFNVDFGGLNIG